VTSTTRANAFALTTIAAVFAIGWLLVAPWSNVPVVDDYAYAGSVEHLLKTGRIVINDRASIYPIVQIVWGTLFARLLGFSFGALRLSTVFLSVAGCWAVYLTLRELAFDVTTSLVGALTLALYPTYFVLSFTFMTDVPFVSLSAVAIYFYVSGVHRNHAGRMWWGTVFAVAAFLVRQVGCVLPLAVLAAADRQTLSWSAARRIWLPVAVGLVTIAALWFALPVMFGPLAVIENRTLGLRFLTEMSIGEYWISNLELLWIVAFPVAPLLVCQFTRGRRTLVLAGVWILLLAGFVLTKASIPEPLSNGQTWSLQDLAMRTNLFDGDVPSTTSVTRMSFVLAIVGTGLVAALIAAFPELRRTEWKAGRVLLAAGLLHFALINLLWVYYDRYYLILMPALIYVAAAPLQDRRLRAWPAVIPLLIWGVISITGTRDVLTTNAFAAGMVRDLESQGVRPFDIDSGYSLNAWRLYVHPENLPPDANPHTDVPFVSTDKSRPYRIVTVPPAGYDILRSEKLPAAFWQVTDHMYVVHQRGDDQPKAR